MRDYPHVVDIAQGHVAALTKIASDDCGLKIYNLGAGQGYSVLEMVAALEKAAGKKVSLCNLCFFLKFQKGWTFSQVCISRIDP